MKYEQYPSRSAKRNYFPLPNEIFSLGLSTGEIATYAYLMRCEDRETYQCYTASGDIFISTDLTSFEVKSVFLVPRQMINPNYPV